MHTHLHVRQSVVVLAGILAVGAALVCLIPLAVVHAATTSDEQTIESYVDTQVRNAHYPGLAVGVVHADGGRYARGFGVADPAGQAVTPHTPFIIGSLSKSFTALAIMQLAEQGRLDLDTSVQRYLPSFVTADRDASSTITVRHLLNQTSGIPKSAVKELQVGGGDETIEDAVHQLDRVHLTAPVGTTFQYSNLNYVTLGLIVQVVSGEPYGTYIERHIFAPLGMRDSFASPPAAHQPGLATPYHWIFGMPVPGVLPFNNSILPAGSLISSADDLTRYLTAQLNEGMYEGGSVLSPSGVAELHRPVAAMPGGDQHYAMGWIESPAGGQATLWHSGVTTFGFESYMLLVPARHIGVVVLANAYSLGADDFADPLGTMAQGDRGH